VGAWCNSDLRWSASVVAGHVTKRETALFFDVRRKWRFAFFVGRRGRGRSVLASESEF